jgi:prepilin-type processing-associated H-X9-DG protein
VLAGMMMGAFKGASWFSVSVSLVFPAVSNSFPCLSRKAAGLRFPVQKGLAAEWLSAHAKARVRWWDWRGERQYAFVDGHVRYLAAARIRPAVDSLPNTNLTVDGLFGRDVE